MFSSYLQNLEPNTLNATDLALPLNQNKDIYIESAFGHTIKNETTTKHPSPHSHIHNTNSC